MTKSANSFHIWISVYIIIILNVYIYCVWTHSSCTSVKYTSVSKVLSNCLIYQQAQLDTATTFCLIINKLSDHVMNINSTTALIRELKPLEAPFLPIDDSHILWLKYQILIYFDGLKTTEVKSGVYEKSEKQKMFI